MKPKLKIRITYYVMEIKYLSVYVGLKNKLCLLYFILFYIYHLASWPVLIKLSSFPYSYIYIVQYRLQAVKSLLYRFIRSFIYEYNKLISNLCIIEFKFNTSVISCNSHHLITDHNDSINGEVFTPDIQALCNKRDSYFPIYFTM